jgi:ribulose-5-phosphate 4-epimerase/fuculose-1-phosphate aldolase
MTNGSATSLDELRRQLALSCRILAATGCVREITGHVSARIPDSDMIMVRCRPLNDPGVEFTTVDDIHAVGIDATNDDLPPTHRLPGEFAIHSEIYRRRSNVGAVAHGHPEASLLCGVLDLPLVPMVGAYDPFAMSLAVSGIPRYPRAVLISTRELGTDVADVMKDTHACLLLGHGVVTTGEDIVEATVRAIKLETLADLTMRSHAAGRAPRPISDEDIAGVHEFLDSSKAARTFAQWTWDFYVHSLGDGTRETGE